MKTKHHLVLFLAIAVLFTAGTAFANTTLDPSLYSFGARQVGMGEASLADKGDVGNIFINPAGLDFSKNWQLSGTSKTLLGDVSQNILAASFKTQWGTIGIGFIDLNANGSLPTARQSSVTGRIIIDPSAEAMGYDNNVLVVSYAKRINYQGDLALGISLKNYNQSISGNQSSARGTAMDLDIGAVYCPEKIEWLTAGFSYQNLLGSKLKWGGDSSAEDGLAGALRLGGQAHLIGKDSVFDERYGQDLIGALDLELPRQSLSSSGMLLHAGIEWKPVKQLAIRLGLDQNSSSTDINYGIGLEQSEFRFDYAYKPDPADGNNCHMFTLSYSPEPERPKPGKKSGAYGLKIISPANKTSTSSETIKIDGIIENAHAISAIKINGIDVMPFVTGNSFEAFWYPLPFGPNVLSVEAIVTSPESGRVMSQVEILRTKDIKDVKSDYFAKDPIVYLNNLNLMMGYSDGSFKPEQPITRAELVTLLVKAKGLKADISSSQEFSDLPKTHWASDFAKTAAANNLATGYPDGSFKPGKNVTRAEAAVIITRFAGYGLVSAEISPYLDVAINNWAIKNITAAKRNDLLKYINKNYFEPNKSITRGEVAYMISKTPLISSSIEAIFKAAPTPEAKVKAEYIRLLPLPERTETTYSSVLVAGNIISSEVKELSVNTEKIKVYSDTKSFSTMVRLKQGTNSLEVTAKDKNKKDLLRIDRVIHKK